MRLEITGSKSRKVTGATVMISWDPENMDVPVIKRFGLPSGSDQLAANLQR